MCSLSLLNFWLSHFLSKLAQGLISKSFHSFCLTVSGLLYPGLFLNIVSKFNNECTITGVIEFSFKVDFLRGYIHAKVDRQKLSFIESGYVVSRENSAYCARGINSRQSQKDLSVAVMQLQLRLLLNDQRSSPKYKRAKPPNTLRRER